MRHIANMLKVAGGLWLLGGCLPEVGSSNPPPPKPPECQSTTDCMGRTGAACEEPIWMCLEGQCVADCTPEPPPPPDGCTSNGQCELGQICQDGSCLTPPPTGCTSDDQCAQGLVCNADILCLPSCTDGLCLAVCTGYCESPHGSVCFSDGDCLQGTSCDWSECYDLSGKAGAGFSEGEADIMCPGRCRAPAVPPPTMCYSSAECGAGESCNANVLCLPDGGCGSFDSDGQEMDCITVCGGYCEPQDGAACYSSYDCAQGFECRYDEAYIQPQSGAGEAPQGKKAMPDQGDMAYLGTCRPIETECWSDDECQPGQHCDGAWECCGSGQAGKGDQAGAPAACMPCPGTCSGTPEPTPPPAPTCVVSGCSGQICASEPMASTCEWLDVYECYKLSSCGSFGADGSCGWEPTDELLACLAAYGG